MTEIRHGHVQRKVKLSSLRQELLQGVVPGKAQVRDARRFGDNRWRRLDRTDLWLEPRAPAVAAGVGELSQQAKEVFEYGTGLLQQRDVEGALAAFHRVLVEHGDDPGVLQNAGRCLFTLGRLEEAAEAYRRALALRPESSDIHLDLGLALDKLGAVVAAARAYHLFLGFSPDGDDTRRQQAWDRLILLQAAAAKAHRATPVGVRALAESYNGSLADAEAGRGFMIRHGGLVLSIDRAERAAGEVLLQEFIGGDLVLVPGADGQGFLFPHPNAERWARSDFDDCFDVDEVRVDEPGSSYVRKLMRPGICRLDNGQWQLATRGKVTVCDA